MGCTDYDTKLFSFAIIWWSLWLSRNKMRLEKEISEATSGCLVLYYSQTAKLGGVAAGGGHETF